MSNRKKIMEEDELLRRLENDRQEEFDSGSGSSSLQSIVSGDIQNHLPPTKLIPLVLTIIGGIYLGAVQIYNFTGTLDKVERRSVNNAYAILQLNDDQGRLRSELESIIYHNKDDVDERVRNLEDALVKIRQEQERQTQSLSGRVDNVERLIERIDSSTNSDIREVRNQLNIISGKVSEIETELRILNVERELNNRSINSDNEP